VLGSTPRTNLKDGLARTIAYFDDLLSGGYQRAGPVRAAALGEA
jgi:hypothetical protein